MLRAKEFVFERAESNQVDEIDPKAVKRFGKSQLCPRACRVPYISHTPVQIREDLCRMKLKK